MSLLIGKSIATEKVPSTIDNFYFWTQSDVILNPFDVIKVEHVKNSITYGVIEEISHVTDSASFLSNFISNDFGNAAIEENTFRISMNYIRAKVVGNTENIFIPIHSDSKVYLANEDEVNEALGLKDMENPLICGYLEMYEATDKNSKITLPVNINTDFLIGPEGAHLNISGISGLASKTSYAMFLLKAIQDRCITNKLDNRDGGIAIIVFNVKGKDLLAIDEINDFDNKENMRIETLKKYEKLGLIPRPFQNVTYLYPCSNERTKNSYVDNDLFNRQKRDKKAFEYKFDYEKDKENLDLMFSDIEDNTQTMDSILNFIISGQGRFKYIKDWSDFIIELENMCEAGRSEDKEIHVTSWRKFTRLVKNSIYRNCLFDTVNKEDGEVRIADKIKTIKSNDVYVVDMAKLNSDMQAFVFGNVIREIINFQLGDKNMDSKSKKKPPSKIIVFIDELNKYASTESRQGSPILKQIIDIAERGRSLGIILFGAEQFKSSVYPRVTGNCSTFAYGRTNSIELSKKDYRFIPTVYQNMLTRLKQGEYIIQNPIFRSLLNIKFPLPIYKQFK